MARALTILFTFMLAACASSPKPMALPGKQKAELEAYSVVAVTDPAFQPVRGQTISWLSDVVFVGAKEETSAEETAMTMIHADIEQALLRKGYAIADGVSVDYRVLAVVQAGDDTLAADMRELFRLYPSLGSESQRQKGMMVIVVARPGSVQALWRGAIKVFVDDSNTLSPEQSRARIKLAVAKVMASMPKAY